MSLLESHIVAYINSNNRIAGTDTNFTHIVNLPARNTYDSVCVLQALIPKSYYLISQEQTNFILHEGALSATISVPAGNYTRRSFQYTISSLLTASSPNGWTYAVSYPNTAQVADTGKFTYTVSGNGFIQPSFEFSSSTYQPCESMGFEIGTVNVFSGNSLTSVNVCRFQAKQALFIKSDCVDNGSSSILQDIVVANTDFSFINFQVGNAGGIHANQKQLIHNNRNSFSFAITDDDNVILNTNGLSLSFSVLFWDSSKYHPI